MSGFSSRAGATARVRGAVVLVSLLATLIPALAACAGGTDHRSPGEVATAFFRACNRGEYDSARSLASADLKRQLKQGIGASMGGISGYCDYYTRNGDLKKVEVLDQRVRGGRASVTLGYLFNGPPRDYGEYGEGDHARSTWRLTREEGGSGSSPRAISSADKRTEKRGAKR